MKNYERVEELWAEGLRKAERFNKASETFKEVIEGVMTSSHCRKQSSLQRK
jgi:hypothetical protein